MTEPRALGSLWLGGLSVALLILAPGCDGLPWLDRDPDGPGPCRDFATAIFTIQGPGEESPLAGSVHTIEGIVIADFQKADLNVIDPTTVGPSMPRVVDDLPTGAKRIEQRSTGILATVVGGQVTVAKGEHTGRFPGHVLRRGSQGVFQESDPA